MIDAFYNSLVFLSSQLLTDLVLFLPKLLIGLVVLVVGSMLAQTFSKVAMRLLENIRFAKALKKTPVEHFFENAELGSKVEEIVASGLYWLVMLVVVHTTVSILGLTSLTVLIGKILAYLPTVLSAVIILFFGLLIAGLVESLVKGAIRSVDGRSARLLGTISSYLVMTVSVLAAISELGIAEEFIFTLFVGFVCTVVLGVGLAVGLGGKDLANTVLTDWYKQLKQSQAADKK